jgi:hypothetical protein
VIVTITMEFDDWNDRRNFELSYPKRRALRFEQAGSKIVNTTPATYQLAQINIPAAEIDDLDTNQRREENKTSVHTYVCYDDSVFGAEVEYLTKSVVAVLP